MVTKVMGLEPALDLLIVDDTLQAQYEGRLHLMKRQGKNGLGTAYIAGFHWCLERHYEYICEMDCDFSHNPDDLNKLIQSCKDGADATVGSRYVGGVVNVVNWPMGRVLMSYYASKYVRIVTGLKVADATAGFICYRRKVLETVGIDKIRFKGYAFQIEMKFRTVRKGFKLVEVPIIFTDRTLGTSKMSTRIFREALFGVIELRWKAMIGKL
jgi:dolichol-phosphate mannosyltransferase